jgi:hypothetical protein
LSKYDLPDEQIYRVGIAITSHSKWGFTQRELEEKKEQYDALIKEIQEIRVRPGIATVGEAVKRGLLLKDLLVRANPLAYELEENDVKVDNISLYLREEWDEI